MTRLSLETGSGPAFDAEPVSAADVTAWKARVRTEALATLDALAKGSDALDESVRSGKIKRGDTVMLEGVGGGFTWGAVLLDL